MRAATLLFVVAAALAGGAAACKGDGAAATVAVVPGAPAGDVTELAGDVHATRDGKPRALAKGDVVSGDDVIATGADGRVTIVLRHNQVAWVLGPNKEKKVGDSAAWAAAKGAAAEEATEDKSAAAGRHAERSATDTAASTGAAGGSGSAVAAGSGSGSLTAQELENAKDEEERRAAQERLDELKKNREEMDEQIADAKQKAAEEKAAAGKGKGDWKPKSGGSCAPGDPLCEDSGGGPGGPSGDVHSSGGNTSVAGAADPASLIATLQAHIASLKACYNKLLKTNAGAGGKIVLHVTLGADGKPTSVDVTGDDALAPMGDCVKAVVQRMSFPAPGDAISFTYPMTFKP